jgi:hypothetical protein
MAGPKVGSMMRDGLVFRSIPLVTSGLAFLPACNDGGTANNDDDNSTDATVTASETGSSEGPDDSSGDDVSTLDDSSSSEEDTGDPQCGGENTCGALPPIGWFGPVVYARVQPGDAPPECPPEVANPGPTVVDGFVDPGPAFCDCTCEISAPQTCNGNMFTSAEDDCSQDCDYYYYGMYGYYGGGCYYGGYGYGTSITDGCQNVELEGFVRFSSYESYGYYGGGGSSCEKEETDTIPPFAWAATIATCRIPETALTCDTGVCVPPAPDGFEAKWCMYQQGDLECPSGPYPNKTVFWSDVEDTRGCSNCQCGVASSSCEDAELMVFGGPDCAGEPIAYIASDNTCTAAVGQSVAGTYNSQDPCPVTEAPVPQGTIAPTGPFTFCCAD